MPMRWRCRSWHWDDGDDTDDNDDDGRCIWPDSGQYTGGIWVVRNGVAII